MKAMMTWGSPHFRKPPYLYFFWGHKPTETWGSTSLEGMGWWCDRVFSWHPGGFPVIMSVHLNVISKYCFWGCRCLAWDLLIKQLDGNFWSADQQPSLTNTNSACHCFIIASLLNLNPTGFAKSRQLDARKVLCGREVAGLFCGQRRSGSEK